VYLINKQYIVGLEVGEQTRQVAGFFDYRTGSFFNIHPQLIGYDPAQRGFTQTGRTMKQDMIQCLTPDFGRFDKDDQVLDQLRLAGEIINFTGTYRILKLFIRRGQISGIGMQVGVGHNGSKLQNTIHLPVAEKGGLSGENIFVEIFVYTNEMSLSLSCQ